MIPVPRGIPVVSRAGSLSFMTGEKELSNGDTTVRKISRPNINIGRSGDIRDGEELVTVDSGVVENAEFPIELIIRRLRTCIWKNQARVALVFLPQWYQIS